MELRTVNQRLDDLEHDNNMLRRMLARVPDQVEMQRILFYNYQHFLTKRLVQPSLSACELWLDGSTDQLLVRRAP